MSWSTRQKKLAHMACRAAGIDDNSRHLLLHQLGGRAIVDGCPTSTSPRLAHEDFEKFMSMVEDYSGGQVLNYEPGYWDNAFINGPYGRKLHRALKLSHQLQDAGGPDGDSVAGVIAKAIGREYVTMHHLDRDELGKAIDAMTAVIKRKGAA